MGKDPRAGVGDGAPEGQQLLADVFAAKRVPLTLLLEVEQQREFHRKNFEQSLRSTVFDPEDLAGFDTYFDFFATTFAPLVADQAAG